MKKLLYIISTLLLAIFITSCNNTDTQTNTSNSGSSENTETTIQVKTVKIGALFPLSGGAATYGKDAIKSYNIILDELNKDLEETNTKLELVIEDSKCNGQDSVAGYNKLANIDKVQVVLGAVCSDATIPAAKITQNKKIPMISPLSSAPSISDIGDYIYRYFNDLDAIKKINEFLVSKGAKNIGIIAENTDYGVGYAEALKAQFNGEVVFYEKFETDEKDFTILAKKVKENMDNIDFLIFIPNNDNTSIATYKALDKEGVLSELISNGKMIGSEIASADPSIKEMGEKIEGLYSTMLINDISLLGENAVSFIDKFKNKHEIESSELFVILDAEVLNLVGNAVKAGNATSEEIQTYLQNINETNKANGYFGEYYFNKSGDVVGLDFLMGIIKNSKLESIK